MINLPKAGSDSRKVFDIVADVRRTEREQDSAIATPLSRSEIVKLCVDAGVNEATARTQYQRYTKYVLQLKVQAILEGDA